MGWREGHGYGGRPPWRLRMPERARSSRKHWEHNSELHDYPPSRQFAEGANQYRERGGSKKPWMTVSRTRTKHQISPAVRRSGASKLKSAHQSSAQFSLVCLAILRPTPLAPKLSKQHHSSPKRVGRSHSRKLFPIRRHTREFCFCIRKRAEDDEAPEPSWLSGFYPLDRSELQPPRHHMELSLV